ncbi:LmbE family protein [Xylanimonas cellulosilytica DSM 15894]|uniref:LmbE family protein n=1 Tax=Xylanimonas cellulosilytica (strain DSM 15894 / JCM 12276 / CECT 5975 / KCTC 9989 / LMG 20990 / NBRC 107835 / XIL07) TaxID=446471 RepID=D1BYR9_XYLCX|nr:PIG-L family deacetylase [Xylanimonas cellulosilytica]ACZ29994.1 LmbE family protein [Xylanimonas cellulosilytica DSM 15894]
MTGDDVVRTTSSPVVVSASRPRPQRLARGVLAVHAHPDDETLSTGALLATCAAWGVPALVVTCTRGERGEVLALPGTTSEGLAHLEGDGPALAAHRERELAAALTALGGGTPAAITHCYLDTEALASPASPASPAELSGGGGSIALRASDRSERFEDSGMVWVAPGVAGPDPAVPAGFAVVPLDDAAGRLARLIREVRPSVVATYEAGGGYGHPDHVRAHQVAARAVALAADPAFDVAAADTADDATVPDDAATPDDVTVPDGAAGRGRALVPWAAELWVRVAAAGELRRERAALAGHPGARALADATGLTFPAAEEALPPVARDDAAIAALAVAGRVVEVDVAPVLGDVVAALRAHATQVQHARALDPSRDQSPDRRLLGWYALSNGVLAPIGRAETYQVVVAAEAP